MKKKLILIILSFAINNFQAQTKIINIEAEGNLESPNPCDCVELSKITNEHNPADILKGVSKCIKEQDYEKAAKLYAIASAYGIYDTFRVKDNTAHQAILVLQENVFVNISKKDQKKTMSNIKKLLKKDSTELDAICKSIQEVGIPKYFPRYMIQHGLQAFFKSEDDGIVEDFNSLESWNLALKNYLNCQN